MQLLGFLGPLLVLVAASGAGAQMPLSASPLDRAAPAMWEKATARCTANLHSLVASLIQAAKDDKRSNADRRRAIFLLGEIGSRESIEFLVSNIGLFIRPPSGSTHGEGGDNEPCFLALEASGQGNWEVGRIILRSINGEKKGGDLVGLAVILERSLGRNLAFAAVEDELARRPTGRRKKNLEEIKSTLASR